MKKKRLISWSIILGIVVAIVLIVATVFSFSEVNFICTTMVGAANSDSRVFSSGTTEQQVEENLYSSAQFVKGSNLLFLNFDENVKNMEKANPYIKIEKIVRRFPSRVDVYYSEREAVALIADSNTENAYYVVDCDLKVLDYISSSQNCGKDVEAGTYSLPIVTFLDKTFSGYSKGDFIINSALKTYLTDFVTGAFSVNKDVSALYEDLMGSVFLVQTIRFYETDSKDTRCEFTLLADNYDAENQTGIITFELYTINTIQSENTYLDKVKEALNTFVAVRADANPTNRQFKVFVNLNGKVEVAG